MERLNSVSINQNPSIWIKEDQPVLKIAALNCHSLIDKIIDIQADDYLKKSSIICLSETWLRSDNGSEILQIGN